MPSHKLFGFQNHRENSCGQRPAFVAIGWSHKLGQDTIHQNYVWSLWLVFRHHSNHVNTCDLSDSLTRAVNLKRVQNFRFIYRIQWKVREFTWFIYLPEWLTQLPAIYQSSLPSPAPCAELTRLSSTKRRSNVVLPVPGLPQTSVVGVMMQKTRSHCCGWGVHKSRKYSYCVAFVSMACIFSILSHLYWFSSDLFVLQFSV